MWNASLSKFEANSLYIRNKLYGSVVDSQFHLAANPTIQMETQDSQPSLDSGNNGTTGDNNNNLTQSSSSNISVAAPMELHNDSTSQ